MNIDNLKPIGAFLEYTIRPLISELRWFLDEMDKKGIKVNEENIVRVLNKLLKGYIVYSILSIIQSIIVTLIVCFTACIVLMTYR